jgi:hypothetical protein
MKEILFSMDIQTEKIKLIEWLVGVNDVTLLQQISKFRSKSVKEAFERSMKPMSIEKLETRAVASNKNIEQGEVYDIEEILR